MELYGKNFNDSEPFGHSSTEAISPTKSNNGFKGWQVWREMKKTHPRLIIVLALIAFVLGACIGVAVAVIAFDHTTKKETAETATKPLLSPTEPLPTEATTTLGYNRYTTTKPILSPTEPLPTEATTTLGYNRSTCPMKYKGKCYRGIQIDSITLHINESRKLCEGIGWNLANIYSTSHYYMIEGYLRTLFPHNGYVSAWTGLTIVPETGQLVLSNGKNVSLPGAKWHSGYPDKHRGFFYVGLDVLLEPEPDSVERQGLWNYDSLWYGDTALCEEPL